MYIPIDPKMLLNDVSPYLEPEHWHCPKCGKEEFMFFFHNKVCKNCYQTDDVYRQMYQCTAFTCASS